jgi:hypothetical protein
VISFNEAKAALILRSKRSEDLEAGNKWFSEMDLNGNGVLEPAEFDQVLFAS